MKKYLKKFLLLLVMLVLVMPISACSKVSGKSDTIRITSLTTTESQIMANIISQLISHETSYNTDIIGNLGSSPMQHQALMRHDADIQSVAYDGGELTANLGMRPIKNSKKANETVRREIKKRWDQTYLPTYGFANNYSFMLKPEDAKKYHLKKISDLRKIARKTTLGVSTEWMNAKGVGYPEFQTFYDISFEKVRPMNIGLVYTALKNNKMDVALGYSTDGRIASYHLKLLKDDRHFFPPYNCGMIVNNYLFRKHPELKPLLHRLDGHVSMQEIREMNYQVDDELLEPSTVAQKFLKAHNYFRKG